MYTHDCYNDEASSSGAWNTSALKQKVAVGVAAIGVVAIAITYAPLALYTVPRVAAAPHGNVLVSRRGVPESTGYLPPQPMHLAPATNSYISSTHSATAPLFSGAVSWMAVCIAAVSGAVAATMYNQRVNPQPIALLAASGSKSKSQLATEYVLEMPGVLAPTGFFDPAGLSRMKTTAQLKYAREAELKHGRVAMLAALGFPFAEEFHPLFPEDKVPSDFSFQLTPLQTYWPLVVLGVGVLETFSIATFKELNDGTWELKDDHVNGDLGFDPLGLKPQDPEKYMRMQNKELSNGRLAMIAIAGMVAQELVVRMDVLKYDEVDIETIEAAANTDIKALETIVGITQSIAMFACMGRKM